MSKSPARATPSPRRSAPPTPGRTTHPTSDTANPSAGRTVGRSALDGSAAGTHADPRAGGRARLSGGGDRPERGRIERNDPLRDPTVVRDPNLRVIPVDPDAAENAQARVLDYRRTKYAGKGGRVVKALRRGFAYGQLREKGETFTLRADEDFSERWMTADLEEDVAPPAKWREHTANAMPIPASGSPAFFDGTARPMGLMPADDHPFGREGEPARRHPAKEGETANV